MRSPMKRLNCAVVPVLLVSLSLGTGGVLITRDDFETKLKDHGMWR